LLILYVSNWSPLLKDFYKSINRIHPLINALPDFNKPMGVSNENKSAEDFSTISKHFHFTTVNLWTTNNC